MFCVWFPSYYFTDQSNLLKVTKTWAILRMALTGSPSLLGEDLDWLLWGKSKPEAYRHAGLLWRGKGVHELLNLAAVKKNSRCVFTYYFESFCKWSSNNHLAYKRKIKESHAKTQDARQDQAPSAVSRAPLTQFTVLNGTRQQTVEMQTFCSSWMFIIYTYNWMMDVHHMLYSFIRNAISGDSLPYIFLKFTFPFTVSSLYSAFPSLKFYFKELEESF